MPQYGQIPMIPIAQPGKPIGKGTTQPVGEQPPVDWGTIPPYEPVTGPNPDKGTGGTQPTGSLPPLDWNAPVTGPGGMNRVIIDGDLPPQDWDAVTPGPGGIVNSPSSRTFGRFRRISSRPGPENQISNTAEMLRNAASRRLQEM